LYQLKFTSAIIVIKLML